MVEIRWPEPMLSYRRQLNNPTMFQCKHCRSECIQRLSKWNFQLFVMLMGKANAKKFTWQRPTLRLLSIEILPKLSEHGTSFKQSIWLIIFLSVALHWYRTQPGEGYANADIFDDSKMLTEYSLLCFSLCCLITVFLELLNSIATILPLDVPHHTSKHLLNEQVFEEFLFLLKNTEIIAYRASRAMVVMLHSILVPLTPISVTTKFSCALTHLIG